ncbi:ABC transporter permease [Desulfotomaculum defluvii]
MRLLIKPFLILVRYRYLLAQTTLNDVKARFAGSIMGMLWLFLYPLLLLGAYAAVYLFIFKVKFQLFDSNEYVALIFCGLIPFLGFAETLGMGVGSVVANANLIKNTLFPIELVPVKAVFVSQFTQAMGMILLLVSLFSLGRIYEMTPLFLIVWLAQILFSIGAIWILASMNVFIRDLSNIVSVLVLFLMMISPIAYSADMIPEGLRPFLALNPLYYMIISYQDILMFGQVPRDNVLFILLVLALLTFILGYWFFMRLKRVFADNV